MRWLLVAAMLPFLTGPTGHYNDPVIRQQPGYSGVVGVPLPERHTPSDLTDCTPEPASQWAPAGWICPPMYGEGWASRYDGQFAAMNFCSWQVRHSTGCGSVRITSLDTGLSVVTPVGEWCHCYVRAPGPNGETARLVDLTRPLVAALGLDWDRGMYRVRVEPVTLLPDTSMGVGN